MQSFVVNYCRRNFSTPCDANLDYCNRQTVRIFFSIMNVRGLSHGASIVELSPSILALKWSRNMIISKRLGAIFFRPHSDSHQYFSASLILRLPIIADMLYFNPVLREYINYSEPSNRLVKKLYI